MLRSLLLLCTVLTFPAFGANEDDPIPYSDDPQDAQRSPQDRPTRAPPRAVEDPLDARTEEYFRVDDPYVGVGAELVGGLMLLDSSQGRLVESRFGWGARAVWELGRLFPNEALRDGLFMDLTWSYVALKEGTDLISATTHYHYFSAAPAWLFRLNEDSSFGAYIQAGAGASLVRATLSNNNVNSSVTGLKPLFQYGVGLRAAPALTDDGQARITFRVEVTRFRRGYMDDTFLGASVGAVF